MRKSTLKMPKVEASGILATPMKQEKFMGFIKQSGRYAWLFILFFTCINCFTQTTLNNYNATVTSYTNQNLAITGVSNITITSSSNPLSGSTVNLTSADAWLYFPNLRPSQVVSSVLGNIRVNGATATEGSNIRVTQYLQGAMVIPHSSNHSPLVVYSSANRSGSSMDLQVNQHYKTSQLGSMNDNIESFTLERGYMATFAANENGTGTSRVYIADHSDLVVNAMPSGLANTASMVVIRPWRWVAKKAWRGSPAGADLFEAQSSYDYNNSATSTLDVEYIPMRHNPGWNAYSNFLNKYNSTHSLFYNEPNNSVDDGYSTVDDAIANYPYMLESGLRVGTPATTDGGLSWTYEFIDRCRALGYRVDFVAWHYYRRGNSAINYYNALKAIHDRTGLPIWITEFNNGCNWTYDANNPVPSIETNGQVIQSFINMLDTAHFVERYFVWDGCNENLRMTNSGNGELYPAGVAYRDQIAPMAYSHDYYNSPNLGGAIIQENATGFCSVDGSIDNNQSGYTGSGFANTTNATGTGINWKVNFSSAGKKHIVFRYASTNDRPANLLINGEVVATNIHFQATYSFTSWMKITVPVNVQAGLADIRLQATSSSGLGNIDYMQITGGTAANCGSTSIEYPIILSFSSEQTGNPATNILDGNDADASRWSAEGYPQWVIIDYGENKSISGTRVSTYQDRAYQFTVELDDNMNFSSPYTVNRTSNTSTGQPISDNFAAVNARYARLTVTGASGYTGTWSSITEFAIVEGSSAPAITNGVYRITPSHAPAQAVEVASFGTTNGSNIAQWSYWGGDFQHWTLTNLGNEYFTIRPVGAPAQSMDLDSWSNADGATIFTWAFAGGTNQQFKFVDAGSGLYNIVINYSQKCLDIAGSSTSNGANLQQMTCNSGANQKFSLTSTSGGINSDTEVLNVYPNPAVSELNINIPSNLPENCELSIVNSSGQVVLHKPSVHTNLEKITISGLQPGMYILKLTSNDTLITRKFTKK